MKKSPSYKLAIYLMLTGTILASCASMNMPIVTVESMERSIVTNICDGDLKKADYFLILLLIASGNFILACYYLFPNEIDDLLVFIVDYIKEKENIKRIINNEYQPSITNNFSVESKEEDHTRNVSFIDEPEIEELLRNELPTEFPKELFDILYISLLKQKQSEVPEGRLHLYEVLAYYIDKKHNINAQSISEYFYQLEALGYGKTERTDYGDSFVMEGIING